MLSVAHLSNGLFLKPTLSSLLSAPVSYMYFLPRWLLLRCNAFLFIAASFLLNYYCLYPYTLISFLPKFQAVFLPAVSWRIPRPRILSLWSTSTSACLGTQVMGVISLAGTHAPFFYDLFIYFISLLQVRHARKEGHLQQHFPRTSLGLNISALDLDFLYLLLCDV